MPFRFRRTIRLAKGLRVNLSKSGLSLSAGERGATVSTGKRGTRVNVGIPGTGLSYTKRVGGGCLLPLAVVAIAATAVIAR